MGHMCRVKWRPKGRGKGWYVGVEGGHRLIAALWDEHGIDGTQRALANIQRDRNLLLFDQRGHRVRD